MELTLEQKKEKVKDLRPIDDVFFEVLASKPAVCQEMLRTILEDPGLIVNDVIPQTSERNLYGRSVRLDALCTLGDGTKVNIEVQRSDNDDHLRRVRFNAASITVKESNCGDSFDELVNVIVVYISEFDFLGGGKTIYHVDKVLRETGKVIDDGQREIFVNTVNDDGTDIADLMSCFTRKQVNNPKFPVFSEEVRELKQTEGGLSAMCKVMEHYEMIARNEGRAEERRLIADEMSKKDQALAASESALAASESALAASESALAASESALAASESALAEKDNELARLRAQIAALTQKA